jgi:hypothetical protein
MTSTRAAALLKRQLTRDCVVVASSPFVRLALAQVTSAVNTGIHAWGATEPRVARLYGSVMTSSALLASSLEGEERVTVRWVAPSGTPSPVSVIAAEATAHSMHVCLS